MCFLPWKCRHIYKILREKYFWLLLQLFIIFGYLLLMFISIGFSLNGFYVIFFLLTKINYSFDNKKKLYFLFLILLKINKFKPWTGTITASAGGTWHVCVHMHTLARVPLRLRNLWNPHWRWADVTACYFHVCQ